MMFHYTLETDKTVNGAIQALERTLQEAKFGVLWQFDIQDNSSSYRFRKLTANGSSDLTRKELKHYFNAGIKPIKR